MAQKYGFFNSVNNDRVYDAADVARFLSKFFTNGIFNNSLAVNSNDNMTVSVATGQANINGYGYENTEILTLDIDEADSELSRIDSVIVRLDLTNRQITAMILQGQYATTPSQPSIIRSGNVYDLRLANILVSAGTTKITTEDITDTRFGSDCGNVTQAVLELSTDEIFNQYEIWFNNWFQNLQDQLDDNQAGHLQNEIDGINNNIGEINNAIDGISQTVNTHYQEQQKIEDEITELTTYSTEEKAIGKWIDGNTLYRKTIDIGSLPNEKTEKTIAHNISDINIVTRIYGNAYNTEGRTFPLPALSVNLSSGLASPSVYVFVDKTNITIGAGVDRRAYSGYVNIEYTKTTD